MSSPQCHPRDLTAQQIMVYEGFAMFKNCAATIWD